MIGHGRSHGAISVINAIPCGIGSTIGVDLTTDVTFSDDVDATNIRIEGSPDMDDGLVRLCVRSAMERVGIDTDTPYSLAVRSMIPPSRGLKSSSSVCNATIAAVLDAYGESMDEMEMLRIGVDCAKEAGVTITGAFDDVCGCHFGGVVFTDNSKNELIGRNDIGRYDVVLRIPDRIIPKNRVSVDRYRERKDEFSEALRIAYERPLEALTINGRLVAEIIGADTSIIDMALENGAIAAGISGTGPAIAAVTEHGKGKELASILGGKTIVTVTR